MHERRRRKKDNAERRQKNDKGREREIRYKRYQDIVNADSTKKVKKNADYKTWKQMKRENDQGNKKKNTRTTQ